MDLPVAVGSSRWRLQQYALSVLCMWSGTSRLHGVGRGTPDVVQMARGVLSWQGLRRCVWARDEACLAKPAAAGGVSLWSQANHGVIRETTGSSIPGTVDPS